MSELTFELLSPYASGCIEIVSISEGMCYAAGIQEITICADTLCLTYVWAIESAYPPRPDTWVRCKKSGSEFSLDDCIWNIESADRDRMRIQFKPKEVTRHADVTLYLPGTSNYSQLYIAASLKA